MTAEPRKRRRPEFSYDLGRYSLMASLLILFFLFIPFTHQGSATNVGLNLIVVATLLFTLRGAWPNRVPMVVAVALAVVTLLPVVGIGPQEGRPQLVAHAAALCLILLVVSAILAHVLTVEDVTLDIVIGAASVYLLLGLLWGAVFALLEYWFPGSFHFPDDAFVGGPMALLPLRRDSIILYFSFETLTTLGYGDVLPLTPPARFLSILEALVGQLYLALLVARYVGILLQNRRARE